MKIVNYKRFIVACLIGILLLGGVSYGAIRGVQWILKLGTEWVESLKEEDAEIVLPPSDSSTLANLTGSETDQVEAGDTLSPQALRELEILKLADWVLGCDVALTWSTTLTDLILNFDTDLDLAAEYYPLNQARERRLKLSLKFIQDLQGVEFETVPNLTLSFYDERTSGQSFELELPANIWVNWTNQTDSWHELETYLKETK